MKQRCERMRAGARRGFTLIETSLATIIVGVGVLAMVAAQTAFHKQNNWSTHASTAERLANEIREMTLLLPRHDPVTGVGEPDDDGYPFWGAEDNELSFEDYDDLDDFDGDGAGLVFSAAAGNGPVNARREIIQNMDKWEQHVFVYNVDPFDIGTAVADAGSDAIVVEVAVFFTFPQHSTPTEMTRVWWIAPN